MSTSSDVRMTPQSSGRRKSRFSAIAGSFAIELYLSRPDLAAIGAGFIPRTEMDIAVVGAGVNLTLDEKGVCSQARVSLGAVAERALLVTEAAAALIGTTVDAAALKRLGAAVSAACRPIDDKRGTKEYRIKVAAVMARRAAEIALDRARRND